MLQKNDNRNDGGLPGLKILYLIVLLVIVALLLINYEINYGWVKEFNSDLKERMIPVQVANELTDEISSQLFVFLFGNVGIILFLLGLLFILKSANNELKDRHRNLITAKENIEEERKRIAAIIANLVDPVLVVNNSGDLLLFNPAANKIFGISPEDIGARIVNDNQRFTFDLFKGIIKKEYTTKTLKEDNEKNPLIEEVALRLTDKNEYTNPFVSSIDKFQNENKFYRVTTAGIYGYNNKKYGQMKICYDLTREKMIDKMKSEFVSILAHQLRTPLSAVKWVFKMMIDGDAGKLNLEQAKLAGKGFESNERVIRLINDLLDVTRIEEGKFGFSFEKHRAQEVIDDVLYRYKNEFDKKRIKLITEISAAVPEISLDKQKLGLAISNLVENAVTYSPVNGTILIGLDMEEGKAAITIKDNGAGIPKEEQARVFTKFFRARNVVRMETEGSGLGLYITKNIVERHGGQLLFESKEGEGSLFKVLLPVIKE